MVSPVRDVQASSANHGREPQILSPVFLGSNQERISLRLCGEVNGRVDRFEQR